MKESLFENPQPLPEPSALYTELQADAVDFVETQWDYGYGGESYESHVANVDALEEWILARERRLLGGQTLEEHLRRAT